jgi:hypothetical protein
MAFDDLPPGLRHAPAITVREALTVPAVSVGSPALPTRLQCSRPRSWSASSATAIVRETALRPTCVRSGGSIPVPRTAGIDASRSLSVCIWNGSSCPISDLRADGFERLSRVGKLSFVPPSLVGRGVPNPAPQWSINSLTSRLISLRHPVRDLPKFEDVCPSLSLRPSRHAREADVLFIAPSAPHGDSA